MPIDIDYLVSLEKIINAYEEIAALRLQNVKAKVLKNRDFLTELSQIFQIVKNSYQKEVAKHKIASVRNKNNKTVRVFISANAGLYGDIIQRVFRVFRDELKKSPSDVAIIGQLGKSLVEETRLKSSFAYFDFPDAKFDAVAAKKLVEFLTPYETVIVYHGVFKNILMQDPASTNITGDVLLPLVKEGRRRRLIFEPSLPQILEFFETEFFSSLLIQTIFEAQLAKFSARMATLDQASENIKEATKQALWEKTKEEHRLTNKKQLNMLAGIQLWGK